VAYDDRAGEAALTIAAQADPAVRAIISVFEQLRADRLDVLESIYAPDVWFKDPFNEVTGLPAVQRIFAHMFAHLEAPHFVVRSVARQGGALFITWDMHFAFLSWQRGRAQSIHGASHLQLDEHGRIVRHRDYWDAAEELYEKLPGIGWLLRRLKTFGKS